MISPYLKLIIETRLPSPHNIPHCVEIHIRNGVQDSLQTPIASCRDGLSERNLVLIELSNPRKACCGSP